METKVSLDELGIRYGTDKSSLIHDFLNFYESAFNHWRDENFVLFEIGVLKGSSIRMWGDYFRNAFVVGLDLSPTAAEAAHPANSTIVIGDANKVETFDDLIARFGRPRIVIDDGSHFWSSQILCLQYFLPKIQPGGIFVMEDIHTSFPALERDFADGVAMSCYEYLIALNRWVVGNRYMKEEKPIDDFIEGIWPRIHSISWYRGTCMIKVNNDKDLGVDLPNR